MQQWGRPSHDKRQDPDFYVKQIKGKVRVKYWGEVRLSTDMGNGKRGELELREVLYMPGMSVNIFSL